MWEKAKDREMFEIQDYCVLQIFEGEGKLLSFSSKTVDCILRIKF